MNEYLMLGEVLKPQGIKGEVKVKPYAANHGDFRSWKTLYIKLFYTRRSSTYEEYY